jgi:hypothetical protein
VTWRDTSVLFYIVQIIPTSNVTETQFILEVSKVWAVIITPARGDVQIILYIYTYIYIYNTSRCKCLLSHNMGRVLQSHTNK